MCFKVFFKSLQRCGILQRTRQIVPQSRSTQMGKALVPLAPRARGTSKLLQDFDRNALMP